MKGLGRRGIAPARPTPGRDSGAGRSLASVLVVLLIATVLLSVIATPVAAHAYLSDADPENGEQLEALPDAVELTFSGDGIVTADVSVTDPDGEDVSGDAVIDPDDDQAVTVPIEAGGGENADGDGANGDGADGDDADGDDAEGDGADGDDESNGSDGMYVVDWEVLADDGHTTTGSFFFVVGDEPLDRDAVVATFEADDDDDTAIAEIVAKALLLVSLVGLVGVSAIAGIVVYPTLAGASRHTAARAVGPVDRRLGTLLTALAALALVSAAGLGVLRGAHDLLGDTLGQVWLFQVVVGILLLSILAVATSVRLSRWIWLAAAFVGGVVLTASMSWTSHSATAIDRLGGTAVDFAHVVGAGLWLGGLAVLALTAAAIHRRAAVDERDAIAALVIRRYSVLAIAGVTLVAATGLVLASWHVPNPGDLLGTTYGLALSIKTMLVVGGLALGGLTRFVLLGRLEAQSDAVDGSSGSAAGEDGKRSGDEERGRSGDERPGRSGDEGPGRSGDEPRPHIGDGGVDASTETTRWIDRAVRFEVLVLVAVVLLSGLVTSVATPAVLGDDVEAVTVEGDGGDTVIELTAIPVSPDADDDLLLEEDEPVVFEVEFRGEDGPVASEGPVRLFGDHAVGDSSFEVALEETDDGTYATVQTLPATGPWDIRVSGSPDDAFVSDWFAATVAPDVAAHGDHDHGDDAAGDDASADDEPGADDEVATGAETPADDEASDDGDDIHDHGGGDDVVSLADDRYPSVPIGDDGPGAFPALLQFGAILIAVGGTVVVTFEYLRAWNHE